MSERDDLRPDPTTPTAHLTEDTVAPSDTDLLTDLHDEPEEATESERPRTGLAAGLHPVNVGHLVMGIAFLGLVGVWALLATETVDGPDTRWLLPLPWLLAGAAGLAATVLRRPGHR
ncbi:MAG TPA: hypothetical protein VGE77_13450 [Nocardioides sp.]